MALDFNMLRPTGGPNPVSSFFQGQQDVASNALAQEQAAQARDLNALRKQQVTGQIQSQEEGRINERRAQKIAGFRDRMLRARDPEAARSVVRMQYADPDIGPVVSQFGSLDEALADISDDPAQFEESKKMEAMGMAEYIKSLQPKLTPTGDVYDPRNREFIRRPQAAPAPVRQPPMVEEFVFARSPEGGGFQGSYQDFVIAREAAKRAPAAPRAAAAGGAGGAPKPMTPVQSAKRRDQLGKEFKSAQNALQTTQDVLDSIAFVKAEPGLSRATGFIGTMLPSIPEGDAASAEVRLKNLEGKVTALGKAQASATGSIGSIATQEWQVLRDQIAAIDRSKGTGPLLSQLDLVEAQAQGALERMKDAYQRQFGEDFEQFPQFADLPAPKSSFKARAPAGGKPAAGSATGGWSVVR
jgi:hypothetical protein